MKVIATSDLHGNLPDIPPCDLLLIGGDVCPATNHSSGFQVEWLQSTFLRWMQNVPAKHIAIVAGNHDFAFQDDDARRKILNAWQKATNVKYLQDEAAEIGGLKVYGSPWQPEFFDWAFNLPEPELEKKWKLIPPDTDILLLHGPPHRLGDITRGGTHAGSESLAVRITHIRPRLTVYGHIHECAGWQAKHEWGTLANVSYVDWAYRPLRKVFEFELHPENK